MTPPPWLSRRSSAEERLNPRPCPTRLAKACLNWGWLSAHNGEDVGSKPTAGKYTFFYFKEGALVALTPHLCRGVKALRSGRSTPPPSGSTVSYSFPVSRSGWIHTYIHTFLFFYMIFKIQILCPVHPRTMGCRVCIPAQRGLSTA